MYAKGESVMRKAGILLHPTALPGKLGMGDFGECAYRFIDFIHNAHFSMWQMLPLFPVNASNSPYQSDSAFAGNVWLISVEKLVDMELLEVHEIESEVAKMSSERTFCETKRIKQQLFRQAFERFQTADQFDDEFYSFCNENRDWLDDYSMFNALTKKYQDRKWHEWPDIAKDRECLEELKIELKEEISFCKFLQFMFRKQWINIKEYANQNGIQIVCDIPIYVDPDSADVWANRDLFQLDDSGRVSSVSGAPPDWFSANGQRWNGCLYQWENHKKKHYQWWRKRFTYLLQITDIIRVDHFNGFFRYWSVPDKGVPADGHWEKGPGEDFIKALLEDIRVNQIIVEDVGNVTEEAIRVRDSYHFMGMQVLQNGDKDLHRENCAFYTGTHDNNTLKGWLEEQNEKNIQKQVWDCIEKVFCSDGEYAFVQLQDILCEGKEARMNIPGDDGENWIYQFDMEQLTEEVLKKTAECIALSGRS